MAVKFYAVKKGRATGIYNNWADCKAQTEGFTGAVYKSFPTAEEAAAFMGWTKESKEDESFQREECEIVAYVDGSYNSATNEYGSGVVLIENGEEICLSEKGNDEQMALMRNVAGEIKASEMAMKYAKEHGYQSLEIVHDYEGIARWCLGEWKTNKEGTKKYKDAYDTYSRSVRIVFTKVKGHSGDTYNDMADVLAKKVVGI
jgi:ribonuclease HI